MHLAIPILLRQVLDVGGHGQLQPLPPVPKEYMQANAGYAP
jgi:hypothetical protein